MRDDAAALSAKGVESDPSREIKRLALQLAAVVDALERRSAEAVGAIDDGRVAVVRAADQLASRGDQLVAAVARGAQAEVRTAADAALTPLAASLCAQLDAAAGKAQHSADSLHKERAAMVSAQRRAFWIGSVVLGVGALAVAGTSTAWVAMKRAELSRIEFAQQIHDATARGALVPCGEQLCVRVSESPRRAGERREFVVVE